MASSREEVLGQQAGVLGEEAEDEAIEEPGDAEVLALGDVHFGAGVGVRQFGAFALLQGRATSANFSASFSVTCAVVRWGLRKSGSSNSGAEHAQVLRAVNLVVGELVGFLDRAVEIGADDVAVEIADDQQAAD